MKPLAELPRADIRALLFDIDDTLTTHGKLTAAAYAALERLHAAGKRTVAVTGRPAGWCDHMARMWPVDAVVGENGAFYFRYANGRLHRHYQDAADVRECNRERLARIAERIVAGVPGCAIAADQPYRETDLAIEVKTMAASAVPSARCSTCSPGSPCAANTSTSNGTITTPPPIPRSPAAKPTSAPMAR